MQNRASQFPTDVYSRTDISAYSILIMTTAYTFKIDDESLIQNLYEHRSCKIHDSLIIKHSKCEIMYNIIIWKLYWSDILKNIHWFVHNCDHCNSVTAWYECWKKMLKSLLISEQIWCDIAINFAVFLSESEGSTNILIIVNQLNKGIKYYSSVTRWMLK